MGNATDPSCYCCTQFTLGTAQFRGAQKYKTMTDSDVHILKND